MAEETFRWSTDAWVLQEWRVFNGGVSHDLLSRNQHSDGHGCLVSGDNERMSRINGKQQTGALQTAIQQERPFHSLQHEAYLSILRTAVELSHATDLLLKSFGVSQVQFNVLRIVQGAGPEGLGRNEIAERMVTVTPDMTRLLDRLEAAGFVVRKRDREDKRQTSTTITAKGRKLLQGVEEPLMQLHRKQFYELDAKQIRPLLLALEGVRLGLGKISESK